MKSRFFAILVILVIGLSAPAFAQQTDPNETDQKQEEAKQPFWKRIGQKVASVKDIRIKVKDGEEESAVAENTAVDEKSTTPASTKTTSAKPIKLADDEPAFIRTSLSQQEVTTKLKIYFDAKDMEPKVDPDTGTLSTDYGMNRRCGPGFYRCEDKVSARISAESPETTVVRLRVIQRKHEGGINTKPWKEENKSKGDDTAKMAAELQMLLAPATVAKQ